MPRTGVLDELKYYSEYGVILLMGISKTSDFQRFFEMKEIKEPTGTGAYDFVCTLTHKNKRFKRRGPTKKEARWSAAEALLAECRLEESQIREKALDIFELATKKHSQLSWDHVYDEFDENGSPRCSYKSPSVGFEKVVSAPFRNKKDAKKDLVFKLLRAIWIDMNKKFDELRAKGIEYDEVKIVAQPSQVQIIPRNKTQLSSDSNGSSQCTLARKQQHQQHQQQQQQHHNGHVNNIAEQLKKMPTPRHNLYQPVKHINGTTNGNTNGHIGTKPTSFGLLQENWTNPLPKGKQQPLSTPISLNGSSSGTIETSLGSNNVCIICKINRKGKRLKDLFENCDHDSFICLICAELHKQMKRAKHSSRPKECPLCYLLRYNVADPQQRHHYNTQEQDSVFGGGSSRPSLGHGVSDVGWNSYIKKQ